MQWLYHVCLVSSSRSDEFVEVQISPEVIKRGLFNSFTPVPYLLKLLLFHVTELVICETFRIFYD